jgi:radical SAM protein with 4Fe4S-binding SPASM domain
MLMVSQLLRVARGEVEPGTLRAGRPMRFGAVATAPVVVVWNVCRHCNMSCPHCYAAAGAKPSLADLSTAEGLRLLDQIAESGVRTVIFSGGEPLLRQDLDWLLRGAVARGLAAQLSTNGTLLDAATARRLRACGVSYVGVSIDGRPDFNDSYRGLVGGYHRALEALRHVQAVGVRTGLRITLTRRNVDQVAHVLEAARSVGAARFYVSHLVDAGRGRAVAGDDLDRGEARDALRALFARAEALLEDERAPEVVTGSNDSDGPFLALWVAARFGRAAAERVESLLLARGGNSAGQRLVSIDHRGRVHPDQFWPAVTLADVRREGFAAALRHPLRDELGRRAELLTGRCRSCRFLASCRGSHRERAVARHGDRWGPDPACVLTDEEIRAGSAHAAEVTA